ncbi:MAG: bifunctional proline dehydrogenase/L-glutamate gamma-semialdehyde dehydrogenase [Acidimicrobiales bacterium]|nr:bifunctional proline dehydrogenase/L-glutamate gamma-semialdehyde dehydrogenase [Acidimicrobiales bacterium]
MSSVHGSPARANPTSAQPNLHAEAAIDLVKSWLREADAVTTRTERTTNDRLRGLLDDPDGTAFAMRFVDRVIRPESNGVAAAQLSSLVKRHALPRFLSPIDKLLLQAGARLAPVLPGIVMPLAQQRMRQLVGHLVVDARPQPMAKHLKNRSDEGFTLNVNLLGEAVLGHGEADRRLNAAHDLLNQPNVDYVSVKVSSIVAQLPHWDHEAAVLQVNQRLRPLMLQAATSSPPKFINLDMEEYHDLELTIAAFTQLLDEPELHGVDAGIVLQAYLPDSFDALQHLVQWATARHRRTVRGVPGGSIKIRLVKGANLAMEKVEAEIHNWTQAPYRSKTEVDANYKRCLDWVFTTERTEAVRIGVGSHNLFDVAWAHLLSQERDVADRVEFEMLQGMAAGQARLVQKAANGLLLYTPVVKPSDFDVAISYLFRRLEENSSDDNFIRHLFALTPESAAFAKEAEKFRTALANRWAVGTGAQRLQDRTTRSDTVSASPFRNSADTDPALATNRRWAREIVNRPNETAHAPITTSLEEIDRLMEAARSAQPKWAALTADTRRTILHDVGRQLMDRRADLLAAMVHEGKKTIQQADPEVSEAIDFAFWYGDHAADLTRPAGSADVAFKPLGVVAVIPPWNFPVAIPAGGVLAALAAGNSVVFKPAPETPRCAEIVAECCWAAGIPDDVLKFVRTPDDHVGRHLITHPLVGGVILTGAEETARLFQSWKPEIKLFAETSGKNALIITPNADLDLAVKDLADSAFGHSGQKCSAASLAICVGGVVDSERFRRQLVDAVQSLAVGNQTDLVTTMGPMIHPPEGKLLRALTTLEPGESWLIKPERLSDDVWSPGVRLGVKSGSWFHITECFGPVLGIMTADTLDEAIQLQNATAFGLTGGIHSLDPAEIEQWQDTVQVGNAYVNRGITGAMVQRQPFGGWKHSAIGPGAKAGGPNYVNQLGTWQPIEDSSTDAARLEAARQSDDAAWANEFSVEHDPTGLRSESNVFRYRPLPRLGLVIGEDALEWEMDRVRSAARTCGVPMVEVPPTITDFVSAGIERVRVLGSVPVAFRVAATAAGVHLADDPVTTDGRIELLHYLREQAISRTLHRYGNLL